MSIQVALDKNFAHVVVYKFPRNWTWEDYLQAFEVEQQLGQALGEQPYCVIADFSDGSLIPRKAGFHHVIRTFKNNPSNFKLAVFVTPNSVLQAFAATITRIYPEMLNSTRIVRTLPEAYQIVEVALRSTLTF